MPHGGPLPSGEQQVGEMGVIASDGSIWYLGTSAVDSAGNHAIYQLSGGQMTTVCVTSTDIGSKWLGMGGPSSSLGLPTGNVNQGSGFQWQNFRSGVIYWSAATGTHAILGNPNDRSTFWGMFAQQGFERGWGLPTSDGHDSPDGYGRIQAFQHYTVVWRPDSGFHLYSSDLFDVWAELPPEGAQQLGRLTSERFDGSNNWFNFEHGSIHVTHPGAALALSADSTPAIDCVTVQVDPPNATCLKNSFYYGVGLSVLSVLKVAPHISTAGEPQDNYVTYKLGNIIEVKLSNFGGDFLHKNAFGFYPAWADVDVKLFPLSVEEQAGAFKAKWSAGAVLDTEGGNGSIASFAVETPQTPSILGMAFYGFVKQSVKMVNCPEARVVVDGIPSALISRTQDPWVVFQRPMNDADLHPAPSPPQPPAQVTTGLENTVWRGNEEDNNTVLQVTFGPNGMVKTQTTYHNLFGSNTVEYSGTYSMRGNTVTITLDNGIVYQGTIIGSSFAGTATNPNSIPPGGVATWGFQVFRS